MPINVKKWGNSAAVRIPAAVRQAARLNLDDAVEVREEGGRIVIEQIRDPEFDLAAMVARITPENRHEETDFGPPSGAEVW
jgi:antitoxin MazE